MPRKGIVLWLVLSVALVMGVLFFSFNMIVRERNAQAHAVYYGQVAYGLAEAGTNLAWGALRRELAGEASLLRRQLVTTPPEELPGAELPLDLEASLATLTQGLGSEVEVTVTAEVAAAALLDPTKDPSRGFDPLEKRLEVKVRAVARFQGLRREVVERRRVRVQSDLLPVVSKFTLFVREPEVETPLTQGYNVYANDIHGSPDTVSAAAAKNYLPLVLYNHGDTLARVAHDLEKNGLVYLGGDRPVKLNLTSGADYRYGEIFRFYNFVGDDEAKQPAFMADAPPDFFKKLHDVDGDEHRYFIKHVIYGYFTVDKGNPPSTMNRDGILERYFEGGGNMRSSVLHLMGSVLAPSPTKVYGNVFQSYPVYSGVTVDADRDGRRDGVVTLLPAIDPEGWELKVEDPGIPDSIRHLTDPTRLIGLDPDLLTYPNMFGDYATYQDFMSALVDQEAYNWSVDYMRSRGEFPIRQTVLDANRDYPDPGEAVELRRQGETGEAGLYFKGDLAGIDSELMAGRAVVSVPDAKAFLATYVREGRELHLGSQVLIERGNLRLPEKLRIEKGGTILCRGSILFEGIENAPGQRLALVSLGGSIVSEFRHHDEQKPAPVDLVALDGRVSCLDKNHALAVNGTVAAKKLLPVDFQGGGRIVWDPASDPTAPERAARARIYVSDRPESWRL